MDNGRELNRDEQQELLRIARQTVESLCQNQTPPAPESTGDGLEFQRGAFVTLHKSGRLRGCIGNFTSEGPWPARSRIWPRPPLPRTPASQG
jgi:AMMECR1 domain-containing protein